VGDVNEESKNVKDNLNTLANRRSFEGLDIFMNLEAYELPVYEVRIYRRLRRV